MTSKETENIDVIATIQETGKSTDDRLDLVIKLITEIKIEHKEVYQQLEINDLIAHLDETKTNDSYDIPVKLIKLARHTISLSVSLIANSSFENGIFPQKLKFAKITPIHKGKSKLEFTNYRPISILPLFSKLLEKAMHLRLIKFLDKHKILFKHQFGFQKNKSTTLAILDLYTKLVENIEGKRFSCCIFLDFSKAFDTVNHKILLDKLEHFKRSHFQTKIESHFQTKIER